MLPPWVMGQEERADTRSGPGTNPSHVAPAARSNACPPNKAGGLTGFRPAVGQLSDFGRHIRHLPEPEEQRLSRIGAGNIPVR